MPVAPRRATAPSVPSFCPTVHTAAAPSSRPLPRTSRPPFTCAHFRAPALDASHPPSLACLTVCLDPPPEAAAQGHQRGGRSARHWRGRIRRQPWGADGRRTPRDAVARAVLRRVWVLGWLLFFLASEDYTRFALMSTAPFLVCVSLFFALQVISSIAFPISPRRVV
ncbi:hypothetical protein B0H14DRAFT_3885743, partial [Mycena olivaceomarginata]